MKYLLLVMVVVLGGCSFRDCKPTIEYVEVNKPVVVLPDAPLQFNRPVLNVQAIKKDSSDAEVAESYVKSIEKLIAYTELLEKFVNSYNTDPEFVKKLQERGLVTQGEKE